jgi:hypothetical protein
LLYLDSNKIAILGTKDVENPPRGKTLQLQQKIRTAATSYLKEQLIALPALPSEAQLKALQDRRRFASVLITRLQEHQNSAVLNFAAT